MSLPDNYDPVSNHLLYYCEMDGCEKMTLSPNYIPVAGSSLDADGLPVDEEILCDACYAAYITTQEQP